MRVIRWGIIGCGDVTEVKSGPALQKAEHSALVAVMRRNGDRARDYAERHGVPRWYGDSVAETAGRVAPSIPRVDLSGYAPCIPNSIAHSTM